MKDQPVPVHELEHDTPTVIQHPDEDMTVLGRWLQRAMEQGPRFWLLAGGVGIAVLAASVVASGLLASKDGSSSKAWIEIVPAKTAEDQLNIAKAYPRTPVADWAKLRAAFEEYDNGLIDLTTPGKKETAGPRLQKALKLFQEVAEEAPKDSSQAIGATLGIARTLEARNEIALAIEQYKKVATAFAGTPEAKQADRLAKALQDPENVAFYKELYAYTPPAGAGTTPPLNLPPGGSGTFDLKSLFPNGLVPPGLDAPPPPLGPTPAPAPVTVPTPEPARPETPAPKTELPANPFTPPK